jgi:hypothetical protein
MKIFQVKMMSDKSCCWSSKVIYVTLVICADFDGIYILAHTMVICHFCTSTVKDNEDLILSFKNSTGRDFLALESNKKTILGSKEEESSSTQL